MEIVPETFPAAAGASCTVKVVLAPVARVAGNEIPLIVTPEPVGVIPETVMLVPPEFVRVMFFDEPAPTSTPPKLNVIGEAVRPGCVPEPFSGTEIGEFDALLATASVPVAAPTDCGWN